MPEEWEIVYYQTRRGESPIFEFIRGLELGARAKVSNALDLLKDYGVRLGSPHVKKLVGTEIRELRVVGGDSIRIFYIAVVGKKFLLLHGFQKKKQKTEQKEISKAEARLRDYKARQN